MIELAALLPPWAALVLAMVSYAVLHEMSLIDIPSARDAREEALLVTATLKKQGATIGQYLIPACLVIGAVVSFARRRSRKTLAAETKARGNMSALLDMSWQDFERLVSEAYRQQGYQVMERGGAGPDGGVDLELKRGSETFLVQCKQWRAQKVGVDVVRELYGVMAARGATGSFVVTSGTFTPDAKSFAEGRNIVLVDGQQLIDQLAARNPQRASAETTTTQTCPACGATMVQRKARKGPHAGQTFWGCSTYPACRGVRQ